MELPKRKSLRLKDFDYSEAGSYFLTICTKNRKQILSTIKVGRGLAPAENHLSRYGLIAEEQIRDLEKRYPGLHVDAYVIMPNHIHLLLSMYETAENPSISAVLCAFKSITTIRCRKEGYPDQRLFQESFYDHIIRNKYDYQKIWEYIDSNVLRWELDRFYEKENAP